MLGKVYPAMEVIILCQDYEGLYGESLTAVCVCAGTGEQFLFLEIGIWQVWLCITATGEHMHGFLSH